MKNSPHLEQKYWGGLFKIVAYARCRSDFYEVFF